MKHYYNEFDKGAAAWLRELMQAGHIPKGDVDERSIREVRATDLVGYAQCHFFAGIGGWPLALRLAGWPEDRPAWTGSCPCQPFSNAGKRKGAKDPRHLWPWFRHLIFRGRPPVAFGEQVASADGRTWLAGVRANLETLGYAVGAADLCAAGVSAPHIRQRLFWVADAQCSGIRVPRRGEDSRAAGGMQGADGERQRVRTDARAVRDAEHIGLGDADEPGPQGYRDAGERAGECAARQTGGAGGVEHPEGDGREQWGAESVGRCAAGGCGAGPWSDFDLIPCRDGKARRAQSGTFPLAHGVPARVGRLRGYGNAIVPAVAAEFVKAYLEVTEGE